MFETKTFKLGAVTINHDSRRVPVKASERVAGQFPYYGASGIVDHVDGYIFDGEYLLVAEDGENLRTRKTPIAFMATGKFWVNNHAHVLQGGERANTRYLCYALAGADISGLLSGSAQPKLTKSALSSLEVKLPSRAYQDAVAQVLGALDEKVDVNDHIARTSYGVLQASWTKFATSVREFVPVAHLAEVDKGLSYKGSGLGGSAPLINLGNFGVDGQFKAEALKSYDGDSKPRHWVNRGDLLMANTDLTQRREILGQPIMAMIRTEKALFTHHVFAIRPRSGVEDDLLWLYAAFRDPAFRRRAKTYATGTTVVALPRDAVLTYSVPWPELGVRRRWISEAKALIESVAARYSESLRLSELRDALLPGLMSGAIRVRDAEKAVEDAV